MTKKGKKSKTASNQIAANRKALHDYHIEERFEAGLVLQGWEVKSLREGRAQLAESYVKILKGEAWLIGSHFSPTKHVSTHFEPDPTRTRKLLLHAHQTFKLKTAIEQKGMTIVPLSLYWKKGRAKLEIGLAKGKKLYDKRETEKRKDWKREKDRVMKYTR